MARTIVIIHPGGLGDVLLAVPAIRLLRARFPRHRFLLCGHHQASELLQKCHLVDHWMPVQATACTTLFGGSPPDDPLLKDWLNRCDFAVAWMRDETGMLAAALKTSGATDVLVRSPFCRTLQEQYQSDRFLETLQEPGAKAIQTTRLAIPDHLKEEGLASLRALRLPDNRPFGLVHPGSGSRHKCLKPATFARVIDGLEHHLHSLILEGPADHDMMAALLPHVGSSVVRPPSLCLLAGILSQAELFVGHDSGVTHLAAILGIPTVALFGPTDPARWAPRGSHVTVLQGETCHCWSWELVSRCADKPCLQLSAEAILDACDTRRRLSRNPRMGPATALSHKSPLC